MAITFINFPASVVRISADDSWRQALNWFFNHRYQAGTEWIYSYGPLGFLATSAYDPDLFFLRLAWELIAKSLLAIALLWLVKSHPSVWIQLVLLLIALVFLGVGHPDSHAIILISSLAFVWIERSKQTPSRLLMLLICVTFAVLSVVKFTYLVFCFAVIVFAEFLYRIQNRRALFSPLPAYVLFFLFFWLTASQSMGNLPEFIYASLQITSGYEAAMFLSGPVWEVYFALAIVCFLILGSLTQAEFRRFPGFVWPVILSIGLFTTWKHGFVRQYSHTNLFFTYSLFCSLVLFAIGSRNPRTGSRKSYAVFAVFAFLFCVVASAAGILNSNWMKFAVGEKPAGVSAMVRAVYHKFARNVTRLVNPFELKARCDQELALRRNEYGLPILSSEIKDGTVDAISREQGVIFLNQWNWRPRPVFESAFTFNPFLAGTNARFFESARAPEYVLFKLQTVDGRFPMLDDSEAMFTLLQRYQPVAAERAYLLLKRLDEQRNEFYEEKILLKQNIRFGEEVSLQDFSQRFLKLEVNIQESIYGRIRRFFFRPRVVRIQIRTDSDRTRSFRFIPSMGRQGFLISPYLQRTSDVVRLYSSADRQRIVGFRLQLDGDGTAGYGETVGMNLYGINDLTPVKISDDQTRQMIRSLDRDKTFRMN